MQVDGYSLDAQRDKLRKYAAYEDMVVAGEYSDEGFSGKNIQGRQEFQRMLNDIQDCKDGVSYVLVFKLSRFGRNAADVLNSLQLMQDFGVNLICVEDGIDSSKDAGKLMISVLSAVAEIERENIRTQTMAGREQKAREGKWNGGFAPYGYKLENGNLVIAEDEVEVIRVIYDRYIHTNEGVAGVAKYLNRNGYVKKLRQNNTIPGFSRDFVKNVLYNPVYMGKIAYGRRRTEKKQGTRNEMHVVEQSEFPVYEGQHEAIISEEDWYLAQEKRKINFFKREKVNNPDHAHILSGILKCPCCGKSMYGNIAKAHSKDKKTRYYYYCKNTVTPTGHECSFRLNIEQMEINKFVAKPVGDNYQIALDEDDIAAIVTREVVEEYELFQKERLLNAKKKQIPKTNVNAFTSLIALYHCNEYLIKDKLGLSDTQFKGYKLYRPDEKVIEDMLSYVESFWTSFIDNITVIKEYLSEDEKPALRYRNDKGGNLLFRPIGILEFVKAAVIISKRQNKPFGDVLKEMNKIQLELDSSAWRGVVWDGKKIINRANLNLVRLMIMNLVQDFELSDKEKEQLKDLFISATNFEGDTDSVWDKIMEIKKASSTNTSI